MKSLWNSRRRFLKPAGGAAGALLAASSSGKEREGGPGSESGHADPASRLHAAHRREPD